MNKLNYQECWLESWKYSYSYDLLEIYGSDKNPGYSYSYENRRDIVLQWVQHFIPRGAKILDVAAGQGNFSLLLAEIGYKVIWNDLRTDLIRYVQQKWEYGEIEYIPGNVFDLQFREAFDAILITEIVEHVAHPDHFFVKICQMLKPGGFIIATTPNGEYFRNRLPKFSDCQCPSFYERMQFKPDANGHIFLLHTPGSLILK